MEPGQGSTKFLLHFSQAHAEFRRFEWNAVWSVLSSGISADTDVEAMDIDSDRLIVVFETASINLGKIRQMLSRLILLKSAYVIYNIEKDHKAQLHWIANNSHKFDERSHSWCLKIRPVGKKCNSEYIKTVLNKYIDIIYPFCGEVDLVNPTSEFTVIEDYNGEGQISKVYFTKKIGDGQTLLKTTYSLKGRKYIGNSTMDPELAFLQANLSFLKPGDLVFDPYCGTGGLLIPCAHFGAYAFGSEINWKVAMAEGISSRMGEGTLCDEHSLLSNFEQYGLGSLFGGLMIADASQKHVWRQTSKGIFDAIITDPPYGVREKCRKLGIKQSTKESTDRNSEDEYRSYPEKQKYDIADSYLDLMDFAADYLVVQGHLSFWFPVIRERYSVESIPRHPSLCLMSNSEQILTKKCSRRLLVYRKIKPVTVGDQAVVSIDCLSGNSFRDAMLCVN